MKIYYTSDVHGYFLPTDYTDNEIKAKGIISASKNFIKNDKNLIIDAGDILQGSVFAYYLKEIKESKIAANIMNKIGVNYITIGNHDFNYGYNHLRDYLNNLESKCICSNVVDLKGEIKNLYDYDIIEIDNKKIGFIGAATDWINVWEQDKNLEFFEIKNTLESLKKAYKNIENCDYKICIYHGGIDFDKNTFEINDASGENIASKIIENMNIDLLLTGHQHLEIESLNYKNTDIVQPSFFGNKYAEIDIDLENKKVESSLKVIDGAFDESLFKEEVVLNEEINKFIDKKIYELDRDYLPEDKLQMALNGSELADLINKIQLEVTESDISITSFANEISGFHKSLTIREILNTIVFPNTLKVCEIDGKTLRQALNKNYEYILKDDEGYKINPDYLEPKLSHYNFDFFYGISFNLDFNEPFNSRIKNIYFNGEVVKDSDKFKIVMNNYRATGVSGFDMYKDLKVVKEINIELSQIVIDYFMSLKN